MGCFSGIVNNSDEMIRENSYRKLQRHFDSMPVPFPSTSNGTELTILESFFAEDEISVAMAMDFRLRSAAEISQRAGISDIPFVEKKLDSMLSKGALLYREEGKLYSLVPLIVGMYEFQLKRLTPGFLTSFYKYMKEKFAFHFLTTSRPQTRILPVNVTVSAGNRISTYDEYRDMIKGAGDRIVVIECICRKVHDMEGDPCRISDRRELCLALRDYADTALHEGWGRKITVQEALELAELNRKDGFVLQSANDRNPNFICACCSDCCGLLNMIKSVPSPADYVESSYFCEVNSKSCKSCRICIKRCPMNAVEMRNGFIRINRSRCIGCGVCTDACRFGALSMKLKAEHKVPPENVDDLYELFRGKKNYVKKTRLIVRYILWKLKLLK